MHARCARSGPLAFVTENVPEFVCSEQFQTFLRTAKRDEVLREYEIDYRVLKAGASTSAIVLRRHTVRQAVLLSVGGRTINPPTHIAGGLGNGVSPVAYCPTTPSSRASLWIRS